MSSEKKSPSATFPIDSATAGCDSPATMKLIEYVQKERAKGRKDGWIAARLGISRPYLIDLIKDRRLPSLEVAQKIAKKTNRKVPLTSWPDRSSPHQGGAQVTSPETKSGG